MRSGGMARIAGTAGDARERRSRGRIAGPIVGSLACLALVVSCGASSPTGSPPTGTSQTTTSPRGCGGGEAATSDPQAPSPACSFPGPTMSPWPVSEAQAFAAANAFTGQADLAVTGQWPGPPDLYVLQDAARTSGAVVDGASGAVVEVFEVDPPILPGPAGVPPAWSPAPAPSADGSPDGGRSRAVAAAARFLAVHGLVAPGASSTSRVDSPGAPAWIVIWADAAGAPMFEVTVDAATGASVAFVDRRSGGAHLAVARVARDTAVRLAIGRANADQGRTDERLISVELWIEVPSGSQSNTWQVGLGVPRPDPRAGGTAWWFSTLIAVDASTGAIPVVK
jgi:hypothetical protein